MGPRRGLAFGQGVEFVFEREVGIDRLARGARHFRQAVIGLRTDDKVNQRHAAQDLGPLGLGHTARNADFHLGPRRLEFAQPTQIGVKLFRSLFADVAGVDQHHIGVVGGLGGDIAIRAHGLGHALAVINVHLTAVGLDEQLFRIGHGAPLFGPAS